MAGCVFSCSWYPLFYPMNTGIRTNKELTPHFLYMIRLGNFTRSPLPPKAVDQDKGLGLGSGSIGGPSIHSMLFLFVLLARNLTEPFTLVVTQSAPAPCLLQSPMPYPLLFVTSTVSHNDACPPLLSCTVICAAPVISFRWPLPVFHHIPLLLMNGILLSFCQSTRSPTGVIMTS